MTTDNQRIVSLFSGCGGLDLGFENTGYDVVFANDKEEHVEQTYNENHDSTITIKDIRDLDYSEIPDCEGIVGGPPCQTWSLAGNLDGADDERGGVFYDYIDIIQAKQPDFFVTENVPGIVSSANIDEFEKILDSFKDIGYTVDWEKMDAEKYGVPQARTRVVIVGVRNDVDFDYQFPKLGKETVQAGTLPACPSKETDGDAHDSSDLHLPNHEHYVGSYSSRFMSRNRVRKWDEPAYTVLAGARYQKIHPQAPKMVKVEKDNWKFKDGHEDEYRRYSVREAARLQTFPDDFIFHYDDVKDGYKMVGNAVPVKLAESVAESLKPLTKTLSDSRFDITT